MNKIVLPSFGRWFLKSDGTIADWLGYMVNGKKFKEPLNIIVEDRSAQSLQEAKKNITGALTIAGYPIRFGHSTGYKAEIQGKLYTQLPKENFHAFSNTFFFLNNNHGRICGPCLHNGSYFFIGSFSRELISPFTKIKHVYGSFNRARDDVAQKLDANTEFKIDEYLFLDNAVTHDSRYTTGDHDGMAAVLIKH